MSVNDIKLRQKINKKIDISRKKIEALCEEYEANQDNEEEKNRIGKRILFHRGARAACTNIIEMIDKM